eukprot:TRINITY_DN2058_c0_g1_i3.p1 TRINITY_DN2058_c0_g1~~TRINITY_DN2058_c0_g1_i3.p1  ORF type:complete len:411 (+),score=102.69 TRINITY_DN2058_c0_g1_i3:61-1293(+)
MSHLDVRMPLGEVSANGLTPNTKAKHNENIREQLKERAIRMRKDHQMQKPEPVVAAPVVKAPAPAAPVVVPKEEVKAVKKEVVPAAPAAPLVEKKPEVQKAVAQPKPVSRPVDKKPLMAPSAPVPAPKVEQAPLRGDEIDAPKYKPATASVIEQKARNEPPATIEVPQKVVAPGITPPNVPPANPKPEQNAQKQRRKLDGQDGIAQACLLPPKREKKRGAVPPPNLGGEAPAAALKKEKARAKPAAEKLVAPPNLNIRREPEVARREEIPHARMLERERERFAPAPAPAPSRDIPNYRDMRADLPLRHLPGGADRHIPVPERHLPGVGLGAPELDRLRFGGPLPGADLHRRPYGAPPAPRDIHVPGGLPHFPPASHLPGFPPPPVGAGLPSSLLDDAAMARRIAMEEYGW